MLQTVPDRLGSTPTDLMGRLRGANVLTLDDVRAAVLETTGDVSVLVGEYLDPVLLDGVIGAERIGP